MPYVFEPKRIRMFLERRLRGQFSLEDLAELVANRFPRMSEDLTLRDLEAMAMKAGRLKTARKSLKRGA